MKKLSRYFLLLHTAMLLIAGLGIWFFFHKYFPDILFELYFLIPSFFYLIGIVFVLLFRRTSFHNPKGMVNLYMLMRAIKMFLSAVIVLIYWLMNRSDFRNFVIIFSVFYLINLIWETYIYMRLELYFKYKRNQHYSNEKHLNT